MIWPIGQGLTNIQVVHAPKTKWDMTGAIQCVRLADQASQNRDIWALVISPCKKRRDRKRRMGLELTGRPKAPGIPIGNAISGWITPLHSSNFFS